MQVYSPCPHGLQTPLHLPFFPWPVHCGFPSPALESLEGKLDLNELLVQRPAATFFVKVTGDSMVGAGIHPGDIVVVDRSRTPKHNAIVLAIVDGEFTVKRYLCRGGQVTLQAENPQYPPLVLKAHQSFEVWGVCTSVIHQFK